jgi:hypothetical protein
MDSECIEAGQESFDGCCMSVQTVSFPDGGDNGDFAIPWKEAIGGPGAVPGAYFQECAATKFLKYFDKFADDAAEDDGDKADEDKSQDDGDKAGDEDDKKHVTGMPLEMV